MATPWTRVQATPVVVSTGTGTVAPTWAAATVSGNVLVAVIAINAPATPPDVTPPTGSGAAWVLAKVLKVNSNLTVAIYYKNSTVSESGAQTWGMSTGTRDMWGQMIEYSHSSGYTAAVDQVQSATATSTAISSGTTGATTSVDDLIIAILAAVGGANVQSSPGGTPIGSIASLGNGASANATATSRVNAYSYEKLATATGTSEIHATLATSKVWGGVIAAFKPVAPAASDTYAAGMVNG
jgi:hypothetical protein